MARAIILTVDDDPAVSQAIARDLRSHYGERYRVVRASSGAEALGVLDELARRDHAGRPDRRRPPHARDDRHRAAAHSRRPTPPGPSSCCSTAYADTDVAIRAINEIGLDHYLMKPWAPPHERLYPVIDDLLAVVGGGEQLSLRRRACRRQPVVGAQLRHAHVPRPQPRASTSGSSSSAIPRRRACTDCSAADAELPLVLLPDGTVAARRRARSRLAAALGLRTTRRIGAVRPRGRRCRAGRPGRRGVRRVGGPAHRGDRA